MQQSEVERIFRDFVMPTYGRTPICFTRGSGCWLWDVGGKKYLDLGAGVAVCSLGHAHPELAGALSRQAKELWHVSNLYFSEPLAKFAETLVTHISAPAAPSGKVFFCNSGGEANEALYKLARKWGNPKGKFEILTATNSFHGRTLAGISATGQEKVKLGFEPLPQGFRHFEFNNLQSLKAAIKSESAAVLIEGIQGEGGIIPATPEFLLGARKLCDEAGLLLFIDAIQCGVYRSGRFHSFARILEDHAEGVDFRPDAISFAKGLGSGFPLGAMWASDPLADVLGPGSHGTTFGGNLLATTVAQLVLDIIERDGIAEKVRNTGAQLRQGLIGLQKSFPEAIRDVRGHGLMLGIELCQELGSGEKTPSASLVQELLAAGLVSIPAGNSVVRFTPPLNIDESEIEQALEILYSVLKKKSSR